MVGTCCNGPLDAAGICCPSGRLDECGAWAIPWLAYCASAWLGLLMTHCCVAVAQDLQLPCSATLPPTPAGVCDGNGTSCTLSVNLTLSSSTSYAPAQLSFVLQRGLADALQLPSTDVKLRAATAASKGSIAARREAASSVARRAWGPGRKKTDTLRLHCGSS